VIHYALKLTGVHLPHDTRTMRTRRYGQIITSRETFSDIVNKVFDLDLATFSHSLYESLKKVRVVISQFSKQLYAAISVSN
jgi:hypothetical protein